jgi:hypothetical protein
MKTPSIVAQGSVKISEALGADSKLYQHVLHLLVYYNCVYVAGTLFLNFANVPVFLTLTY